MATQLKIVKIEQGLLAVLDNNVLSAKHFIEKEKKKIFCSSQKLYNISKSGLTVIIFDLLCHFS